MAIKKQYYTVDGQIIGYKDASGRKDYLTDALGSVTAEVDQTGATKTFDGRYKPYGGDLSSTGIKGNYDWVGSWGYRGTNLSAASHYVRARTYCKTTGSWSTIDPLGILSGRYQYVHGQPTAKIDNFGLFAVYVNAFIHKDQNVGARTYYLCGNVTSDGWNPAPWNPSGLVAYRGDDRDFSFTGNSRLTTSVIAEECRIGRMGRAKVFAHSDPTRGLVVSGTGCLEYQSEFPTANLSNISLRESFDGKVGISIITYKASANDPLVGGSPHLRVDVTIHLIKNYCTGDLNIHSNTKHTRYPWWESYVKGIGNHWLFKYRATPGDLIVGLQVFTTSGGFVGLKRGRCKECCEK